MDIPVLLYKNKQAKGKIMECKNCSGNDFKITSTGNYKCKYCGTLYYEERRKVPRVKVKNFRRRILIISAVVGLLVTASLILYVGLEKEESSEWSRDEKTTEVPDRESNSDKTWGTEGIVTYKSDVRDEPLEGKVLSSHPIRDSIGNIYFVAIVKNTGKAALRKPLVLVRLYSGKGEKLDTGRGYGFKDGLNPGEKTPVYILIKDYPKYSSFKTVYTPEKPFIVSEDGILKKKFKGEVSSVTLKKGNIGTSYRVLGRIKNKSLMPASYVKVAAVLYNKKNEAIGYGTGYIGEKLLQPGDSDNFKIYITTVKGKPDHYDLYHEGMLK